MGGSIAERRPRFQATNYLQVQIRRLLLSFSHVQTRAVHYAAPAVVASSHVRAYGHERQDSWFDGLESAFRAFDDVSLEVLLDNAKTLILHHDPASREVVLRLHAMRIHSSSVRYATPMLHRCSVAAFQALAERLCRGRWGFRRPLRARNGPSDGDAERPTDDRIVDDNPGQRHHGAWDYRQATVLVR